MATQTIESIVGPIYKHFFICSHLNSTNIHALFNDKVSHNNFVNIYPRCFFLQLNDVESQRIGKHDCFKTIITKVNYANSIMQTQFITLHIYSKLNEKAGNKVKNNLVFSNFLFLPFSSFSFLQVTTNITPLRLEKSLSNV